MCVRQMDLLSLLSELAVDGLDAMFGGGEEPAVWAGARLACKTLRSLVEQHTVRSKLRVQMGPEVGAWQVGPVACVSKRCKWVEVHPAPGSCSSMITRGDGCSPDAPVERLDMRLPSVQVETVAALAYSMGFTRVRHLSLGACCQWAEPAMEMVYEQMAAAMPLLQILELPITSCIKGVEVLKGLTTVRAVPANIFQSNQLLMRDTLSLLQLQHLQTLDLCLTCYGPKRSVVDDRWAVRGLARAGDEALLEQIDDPCIREQMYALRLLASRAPKCLTNINIAALACCATDCCTFCISIGFEEGEVQTITVDSVRGWCFSLNFLAAALLPVVSSQKSGKFRTFRTDNLFMRYAFNDNRQSDYFKRLQDNTGLESPLRRLLASCTDVGRVSALYLPEPFWCGVLLPEAVTAIHNIATMFGSMPFCVTFHDPYKEIIRQLFLVRWNHGHAALPRNILQRVNRRLHVTLTQFIANVLLFGTRFHSGQRMPVWAQAWRSGWNKALQLMWDKFHLVPQSLSQEVDFLFKLVRIQQVMFNK